MRVSVFDFDLPQHFIAQHPATPKDSARLLVVRNEEFQDLIIRDLPGLLRPKDVIVVNDTRVIPARLEGWKGKKEGEPGPRIEVTLLKSTGPGVWQAFARPAKKLKPGDTIAFAGDLTAKVAAKGEGGEVTLAFPLSNPKLLSALDTHGAMPLPPYIKRQTGGDSDDKADYQTLFADHPGAVAAPTAGLHFTPELVRAVELAGAAIHRVTLHVGAGTFLPVKVDDTRDHHMHTEWGEINAQTATTINAAKAAGGRIIAIGTTALRLLEAAADNAGDVRPFSGETDIFITPGYRFKIVDGLLTNFHLPRSTLFMLVSAFSGLDRMKAAYEHAMAVGYRFYSYGDACFLERSGDPS
ncbi:MAG: tRNA preQ1(34) S-adenosylmethionine ribosyltransferase-isomerase QueA [Rhodospirillales bacterium]|nr:tRNA preQ1(34) S-adenosylmethionine ribosyltransferase-isomerase QueA [Rhodospirillales bacterium]